MTAARPRRLDVAVIGAGMSGLVCAHRLAEHGHAVRVFDKGRGPGGRMATRRDGERRFDHGAQYFTVRDRRFGRQVEAWRAAGLVGLWQGAIAELEGGRARPKPGGPQRFVGVPGMSAICRHLAAGLEVAQGTRVERLERHAGRWRLSAPGGAALGSYDAVVLSAPAPQTAALAAAVAPEVARRAAAVEMTPCWAAMAAFSEPLATGFDGAFVAGSPLGWVARNGSKPGRPAGEAWVLHASPGWSAGHLDLDPAAAGRRLLDAFGEALGGALEAPLALAAHLWLYALPTPLAEPCLVDPELRLAACGDWCGGPRVEGAYLSGAAAASSLTRTRSCS